MRISAFLLSILLLLLVCLPCGDALACAHDTQDAIAHHSSQDQNTHHSENDKGCCSPLCQCACCAVVAIPSVAFHLYTVENLQVNSPAYASLMTQPLLSRALAVWQPPQL